MENRTLGEQLDDHQFDAECDQRQQKAINEAVEFEIDEIAKLAESWKLTAFAAAIRKRL